MPNYELKAYVLSCGMYDTFKKIEKDLWINRENAVYSHEVILYRNSIEERFPEEYKECKRIWKADHNRRTRLSNKIRKMVESESCTFITLTFRDDVLEKTSTKTRRAYVTRYLKTQSDRYIANIDYGDITDREHYHGVVCGRIDMAAWKYGYSYAESIKSSDDSSRLAMYVTKLTNHAIKETTKRNSLIYSKNVWYNSHEYDYVEITKELNGFFPFEKYRDAKDWPFT